MSTMTSAYQQREKSSKGNDKATQRSSATYKPVVQRRQLEEIIQRVQKSPNSLTRDDMILLQRTIGNKAVIKLLYGAHGNSKTNAEAKPMQTKGLDRDKVQSSVEEKKGMPHKLRAGLENLSGHDLSDVRVHRNSDKPQQIGALAYTQGTDIHIAPGQEKHLPHEGWHVVQQKTGRVKPTLQMKTGTLVNDDAGLEKEADIMGRKATQEDSTAQLQKGSKLQHGQIKGRVIQLAARFADEATAADVQAISAVDLLKVILDAKDKYAEDEKGWRTLPGIGRIESDKQKQARKDADEARSKICESEEYKSYKDFKKAADEYLSKENGGSRSDVEKLIEIAKKANDKIEDKKEGETKDKKEDEKKEESNKEANNGGTTDPNSRRDYIYNYLIESFGVNHLQACAILGNIYVETWHTYSPLILQGSQDENSSYVEKYNCNDSKGWGILQWTYWKRKKALLDYAKKKNAESPPVGDLTVQLEYFNMERKDMCKSDWDKFKSKKSLEDMVKSFCEDYERAGAPHLKERIEAAKEYDKAYKK